MICRAGRENTGVMIGRERGNKCYDLQVREKEYGCDDLHDRERGDRCSGLQGRQRGYMCDGLQIWKKGDKCGGLWGRERGDRCDNLQGKRRQMLLSAGKGEGRQE